MKLIVPKAQRVGGLRGPHLNRHIDFRPCSYEETYEAWKVEQEDSCYLVMA